MKDETDVTIINNNVTIVQTLKEKQQQKSPTVLYFVLSDTQKHLQTP